MNKSVIFLHSLSFGRSNGGVGNSCYRITSQLLEIFEVVVFIPNSDAPEFTCEKLYTDVEGEKLLTIHYSSQGSSDYKNQFLNDIIINEARKLSPVAIMNFFLGDWSFALTQASNFLSLPLFNFCRGNDIDLGMFQTHKFDLIKSLESAAINFCVSQEMQQKIKSITINAKTKFVANSVDFKNIKNYATEYLKSPQSFAIVGHIKRKKGLELILDKINYEDGEMLSIIGDIFPPQARYLHGFLTLNHRFSDSIVHYDFINEPKKLFHLMAKQDVICIPSLHDGMPNVLLEAMAMGKVVIASNVGGIKDVITDGDNGLLFNPFDEQSVETVFNKVRNLSASELNILGQNAQATIEQKYLYKHEKKRYHKFFNSSDIIVNQEHISDRYSLSR